MLIRLISSEQSIFTFTRILDDYWAKPVSLMVQLYCKEKNSQWLVKDGKECGMCNNSVVWKSLKIFQVCSIIVLIGKSNV